MSTERNATPTTVRRALSSTFDAVDHWFDLPADARCYRPLRGSWTIDEILEHISLTNHFLLKIIRKGCEKAIRKSKGAGVDQLVPGDLDKLGPIGQRGTFRWIRPEHMEPTGQYGSEEIREHLHRQLEECVQLLDRMPDGEGSLYKVRMSVNDCGKLDMYQWLYFLAQHAHRHIEQMELNLAEQQSKSSEDCGADKHRRS